MTRAPTIPQELVYLGDAVELDGDQGEWKWSKRANMIVAANVEGNRVYIFERDRPVKNPTCHMGMRVQSFMFDRNIFDQTSAKKWLKRNGAAVPKVDATDKYLHFRQEPKSHFSFFRTGEISRGVKASFGCPMKKWSKNPAGETLFKKFSHKSAKHADSMDVPNPKIQCGRAVHIVYSSNKTKRGGKKTGYIHQFETPPIVWVDRKKNPSVLVLTGGHIRITKDGIEG